MQTSRIYSRRVLVTGGAGFLGSHLCDRLLADGNEVVCLDNLFSSCKENIALAREKLAWEPRVPLEEGLRDTVAYFREKLG